MKSPLIPTSLATKVLLFSYYLNRLFGGSEQARDFVDHLLESHWSHLEHDQGVVGLVEVIQEAQAAMPHNEHELLQSNPGLFDRLNNTTVFEAIDKHVADISAPDLLGSLTAEGPRGIFLAEHVEVCSQESGCSIAIYSLSDMDDSTLARKLLEY